MVGLNGIRLGLRLMLLRDSSICCKSLEVEGRSIGLLLAGLLESILVVLGLLLMRLRLLRLKLGKIR